MFERASSRFLRNVKTRLLQFVQFLVDALIRSVNFCLRSCNLGSLEAKRWDRPQWSHSTMKAVKRSRQSRFDFEMISLRTSLSGALGVLGHETHEQGISMDKRNVVPADDSAWVYHPCVAVLQHPKHSNNAAFLCSNTWVRMPGIDSGTLDNGIEQLLRGVELGGEDAEGVERESDGVRVRVTGRHCLGIVGEGCGNTLY